jgi:multidrug resistance efflux pump
MSELKVSGLVWKRLRRILFSTVILAGAAAGTVYAFSGGRLLLDADGMITSEHVSVTAPFEARIRQVLVRPGDTVVAGQAIAIVDSATISRSLAELASDKARIVARLAQLEGRRAAIKTLLPIAEASAQQSKSFLDRLSEAKGRGLAVEKSLNDTNASYTVALERAVSLRAEQVSIEHEAEGNQEAFREVSTAYANLQQIYNNGVLTAPADGYVGSAVSSVGEVLTGNAKVAQINTGRSYALAYLPEGYLLDVEEGQKVGIQARGQVVQGQIDKVLPITEALPPEFQLPNKARERGQLVRIALNDGQQFALDQKVRITNCLTASCNMNVAVVMRTAIPTVLAAIPGVVQGIRNAFSQTAQAQAAPLNPSAHLESHRAGLENTRSSEGGGCGGLFQDLTAFASASCIAALGAPK